MAPMEIMHVIPFTAYMEFILVKKASLKSLERFELIALISDAAVEIIASNNLFYLLNFLKLSSYKPIKGLKTKK
jgi:hypothetical protein